MNKNYNLLFLFCILTLIATGYSFAQIKSFSDLFSLSTDRSVLESSGMKNFVANAELLQINKLVLNEICDYKYPEISISIPYKKGSSVVIYLKRFDIQSPDAKLIMRTAEGNEEIILDDIGVSYTGNLDGHGGTFVVLNFARDKTTGFMSMENENYILGALKDNSGNETDDHILYKESDLKYDNPFNCLSSDIVTSEDAEKMKKDILEQMNDSAPNDLRLANIAIDVDNITYNNFGGSIQATTNYITSLMSGVSALFMKEVNVKLTVSYLRIWTTPDPYGTGTIVQVFDAFVNEWRTNQGSVQRTVAHLISTRSNYLGGIGNYGVLCNNNLGYAFTNTVNNILPLPTYFWDVFATTHEFGHNFGSPHTHNCTAWIGGPIDSCYTMEGNCYAGPRIPRFGTIMSYCHRNGGAINFREGFGPQPRALIRSRAESASCMSNSQRSILVGYPNGLETFRKGRSIQIYWGTSLTSGNVNIELSTDNGSSWQSIYNNVPATQKAIDWTIPDVALTTQAKIRILNSSNSAEGDTSDAAFTIQTYLNPYNITLGIEGFWNGTTQVADTAKFYFRSNSAPFNIMDSSKVYLNTSGNIVAGISNTNGGNYYIQFKHRNALETWSFIPVSFSSSVTPNINFTTFQSGAYGSNQKLKSGRWCFYSGDVNQQGSIDLSDEVLIYNDAGNFLTGYLSSDVNGDSIIDLADLLITHNNSGNFIVVKRP